MGSEIIIEGLDDLFEMFDDMEISESKQRKALNIGGDIIKESMEDNAPEGETGKLKNTIKKTIKNKNGDLSCIIKSTRFYDVFTEYGTSVAKHDVGWVERAVKDVENEAVKAIKDVILK